MPLKPIESNMFTAWGYDTDQGVVTIHLVSGAIYEYHGIPPSVAEELEKAKEATTYKDGLEYYLSHYVCDRYRGVLAGNWK